METRAPRWRSRKCASEAHTGRKPSPGHAHLPVASEVYLRQLCSLTASPRRRPDHRGVQAEAEGRVGMAEGGSPEGRAGPRAAGNVSGVGWWGAGGLRLWISQNGPRASRARVLRPRRPGLRSRTRGQLVDVRHRGAQGATPTLGLPWSALSRDFFLSRVGLVTATLLADPSQ